ncbi:MAG: hypothetical protein RMJ86_09520 [Anaerolineae bacterium]|nr:hypothetical protein [Anaerolineae bacterium]
MFELTGGTPLADTVAVLLTTAPAVTARPTMVKVTLWPEFNEPL